jgi:hypothetical protein
MEILLEHRAPADICLDFQSYWTVEEVADSARGFEHCASV